MIIHYNNLNTKKGNSESPSLHHSSTASFYLGFDISLILGIKFN